MIDIEMDLLNINFKTEYNHLTISAKLAFQVVYLFLVSHCFATYLIKPQSLLNIIILFIIINEVF